MAASRRSAKSVRAAQAGALMGDVFPVVPTRASGRRAAPAGGRARARARSRPAPELAETDETGRQHIIGALVTAMDGLYAHLPLKRARYAVDPVQRLRLLGQRSHLHGELEFHHQLGSILTGLRDAHTRYVGPTALEGQAAHLGFLVESFGPLSAPRYVVSKVVPHLVDDPRFVAGVELVWWNAVPIDRAVDRHADQATGGRPDTRRARALESLTIRALQFTPPPEEYWVDVGYVGLDGEPGEIRLHWRIVAPGRADTAGTQDEQPVAADPAAETARRVKKLLFAPEQWAADQAESPADAAKPRRDGDRRRRRPQGALPTTFEDIVAARTHPTDVGDVALLRLWSFDLDDDDAFVAEVARLLGELPTDGLIVDLRANPGGLVWAAERLLQLFTPRAVQPTRFAMLATPLTRAMAAQDHNALELGGWRDSLELAVETGEQYSVALPLTSPEACNDIGQVYPGPVVAVVDALTYSAGDLFAAGFIDNQIGPLVTVGAATGAGGAQVWTEARVRDRLAGTGFAHDALPGGASYTIAVRRAIRTMSGDGAGIEDLGVQGTATHEMTVLDLQDNRDLYNACAKVLRQQEVTDLRVDGTADGAIVARTTGLERLDVVVDGQTAGTYLVADGEPVTVALPAGWERAELTGYVGREIRQRRLLKL